MPNNYWPFILCQQLFWGVFQISLHFCTSFERWKLFQGFHRRNCNLTKAIPILSGKARHKPRSVWYYQIHALFTLPPASSLNSTQGKELMVGLGKATQKGIAEGTVGHERNKILNTGKRKKTLVVTHSS